MKKLTENLANLFKVKTIVTLVVLAIFSVLALRGDIPATEVMIIVSMVVSFYFGTQHEKGTAAEAVNTGVSTEAVTTITEKVTPVPEPVDAATYIKTHPDEV